MTDPKIFLQKAEAYLSEIDRVLPVLIRKHAPGQKEQDKELTGLYTRIQLLFAEAGAAGGVLLARLDAELDKERRFDADPKEAHAEKLNTAKALLLLFLEHQQAFHP